MITFALPLKTESESNKREHWGTRSARVKKQRLMAAKMSAMAANKEGYEISDLSRPIVVKMVRIGKRRLDDDNLSRSFKAIRDGIADTIGIDDDSEDYRWICSQVIGEKYSVVVSIC